MVSPPTINTPTNFGAAQSRALKTNSMESIILNSEEWSSGSDSSIEFTRVLVEFIKGTKNFDAQSNKNSRGGKPWISVSVVVKDALGNERIGRMPKADIDRAKENGKVTEHPKGWVINVPGTFVAGWAKCPTLKMEDFDENAAKQRLRNPTTAANPTPEVTNDAGW